MSYEGQMLQQLKMPTREEVEQALLQTLFSHNGVIKEFAAGEDIVAEIANQFDLNEEQRSAYLETVYRKENRVKRVSLWHRLLYRAADNLAKQKLISRPTQTEKLTNRREWMLTEDGYDQALKLSGIPTSAKDRLSIKSFEVEKLVQKLTSQEKPENYSPITPRKRTSQAVKITSLRSRGFRQAVIEAYDCKCAVCGLKLYSPRNFQWEVEAAHIVPHSSNGRDDVWNGLSLCRLHHWAFDVGWYSFDAELRVTASVDLANLPEEMGRAWSFDLMSQLMKSKAQLPENRKLWPDLQAIEWHRDNILQKG